jgi:dTDP-4-dehydrorhamnose 3,5-epimerase
LELLDTRFPEVRVFRPRQFADARGFFSEVYSRAGLREIGIDVEFVQDNHSLSIPRGVVRGLHFQSPPFAQAKLVRVVRGAVVDVAVDIRRGSPNYGRHVSVTLSAELWNQIYVPEGFAHGFCTIEPNTEVLYKVDRPYSAAHDRGLSWNDPALAIDWPVASAAAIVSDKDRRQPLLAQLDSPFAYAPPPAPPVGGGAAPGGVTR